MNKPDKIIVHCADTRIDQNFDVSDIDNWHKIRGFKRVHEGKTYHVGYHFYIKLDGTVQNGRPISCPGAHCKGQNSKSIGVCFEGGKNESGGIWDNPTQAQIDSFKRLLEGLEKELKMFLHIHGHNEYSNKSCPNFDVSILYYDRG
jgi:N-acetylmuramoyl-L-alanine amidase